MSTITYISDITNASLPTVTENKIVKVDGANKTLAIIQ